jgi:hypothetical protein
MKRTRAIKDMTLGILFNPTRTDINKLSNFNLPKKKKKIRPINYTPFSGLNKNQLKYLKYISIYNIKKKIYPFPTKILQSY